MANREDLFGFLESVELSDVGRRRRKNEDSVRRIPSHGVFCVADGMGGEDSGDVASLATINAVEDAMEAEMPDYDAASSAAKKVRLAKALQGASQWIQKRAEQRGRGLSGSTVVTLIFDALSPTRAVAMHAGDSRIYRYRDGDLQQITRDHSLAEEAGFAKKNLPKVFRGMVTRGVGIRDDLNLEETAVDVREKDVFLLCSDGLSGMVSDRRLRKIIHRHENSALDELARAMIQEANDSGGEDNVSVILVRVGALKPVSMEKAPDSILKDQATEATRPSIEPPATARRDTETADTPVPCQDKGPELDGTPTPRETAQTLRRNAPGPGFLSRLAGRFRKDPNR